MTFVLRDDRDNDCSIPFSLNSRVTKKQSLKLVVKIHISICIYIGEKRMGVLKELIIHNHKEPYKLLRCIESCHFQIS